jgi:arylsulfatase A-like enzyme
LIRARERGWYDQADDQRCRSLAGYYGNISQMDACVGRVYDALRELGLEKNTVVVYTSDHGEMAGDAPYVGQAQHVRTVGGDAADHQHAGSHPVRRGASWWSTSTCSLP